MADLEMVLRSVEADFRRGPKARLHELLLPGGLRRPPAISPLVVPDLFFDHFLYGAGDLFTGPIGGWSIEAGADAIPGAQEMDGASHLKLTTGNDLPWSGYAAADKALPAPETDGLNRTVQFRLTEEPTPSASFEAVGFTSPFAMVQAFFLVGDGSGFVGTATAQYQFAWVPDPGGTHRWHYTVDPVGVCRVWRDQLEIPLVPAVFALPFGMAPNIISLEFSSAAIHRPVLYDYVAEATGVYPEPMEFVGV